MAAVTRTRSLNFAADLPDEARQAIETLLGQDPGAGRKIYAALAHKVWSLLVERRLDAEIRDWHDLLHGVRARLRESDTAAAERLTALADLLRESISLAQSSPASAVANRPRARGVLDLLDTARGFVPRRRLLEDLALGGSNLSNVLTQLSAHALIERRVRGKEAEYRITPLGRQLIGADGVREDRMEAAEPAARALAARVQSIDPEQLRRPSVDQPAVETWGPLQIHGRPSFGLEVRVPHLIIDLTDGFFASGDGSGPIAGPVSGEHWVVYRHARRQATFAKRG